MDFKKLYRSRKHCLLCGVCGGIGEYAGVDPVLIRLIFLCLCLVGGGGLLLYLLAVLIQKPCPCHLFLGEDIHASYFLSIQKVLQFPCFCPLFFTGAASAVSITCLRSIFEKSIPSVSR